MSEAAHAHQGGTRLYLWVWTYLLILTGVEVFLAYEQFFSILGMLVILMVLSIIKAGLIIAYFMHLRFERRSLIVTLIPVLVVVIGLLFAFFPDSYRLFELRPR
jgi:cytochrome c oxidase subunit 4